MKLSVEQFRQILSLGLTPEQLNALLDILKQGGRDKKNLYQKRWRERKNIKENQNTSSTESLHVEISEISTKGIPPCPPLPLLPETLNSIPPIIPPSKIKTNQKENPSYSTEFISFWQAYPKNRGSKFKAWEKYQQAVKNKITPEILLEGAKKYFSQCTAEGTEEKFIAHAATWLHQRRWEINQSGPDPSRKWDRMPSVAGG